MSRFRRLAITHAAMIGGDAAMLVALANSLFFSIDPNDARWRVLLFLLVSFAPFVVIAPLIGPVIDRAAGGRRTVIQLVAAARVLLCLGMAGSLDGLVLFPLAFASLVAQKAYLVSKSAIVPSVVNTEDELVEANAKLGVLAGLAGVAAVIPAALLQLIGPLEGWAPLVYAAALFAYGAASATRLPVEAVAGTAAAPVERSQLRSPRLQSAAVAMLLLRAAVGFLFFHLAFWLRSASAGTFWFGVAITAAAAATMAGNVLAPRARYRLSEERMLSGGLGLVVVAGAIATVVGGPVSGVVLAAAVNFAAAVGRLAFESLVQRVAPQANRGRVFAQFETRFQLAWVLAGIVPVVLHLPGRAGFLIVAVIGGVALGPGLRFVSAGAARLRTLPLRRRGERAAVPPGGPATGRARPPRWASEQRRPE